MNSERNDSRDWHERRIEELRQQRNQKPATGEPESPASRETFPEREKRPGEAGLANEVRPGLGTRGDQPGTWNQHPRKRRRRESVDDNSKPKATPHGYEEPRPEPREQAPDSLAHEEERSTGVSGHMGNV